MIVQNENRHPFLAGIISFAVSLAVNGAVFYSLDPAFVSQKQFEAKKKADSLQFEFVEAPPKTHPRKPAHAKKIAAWDALNEDQTRDKSKAKGPPDIKAKGLADQLAQREQKSMPSSPAQRPDVVPRGEVSKRRLIAETKHSITSPRGTTSEMQQIVGLTGRDRITTQAMSRRPSEGAKLFGATSFEATGSGMGEYMKNLKEKVWMAWFPYLAFQYPSDFRGADAVISFTLNSKGEVKILKMIESRGSPAFADYCLEAIQKAGTFGKVPEEILALTGKEEIEIKFGFHYG